MRYLPYCILRASGEFRAADETGPVAGIPARGVDGQAIALIAEAGLAAAYSAVPGPYPAPNVRRATAYARVVTAFHRMGTVLPLRYGRLVRSPAQLGQLLRERRAEFHALLDDLEGCEEMALHRLLRVGEGVAAPAAGANAASPGPAGLTTTANTAGACTVPHPLAGPPGARYLAHRRAHYVQRERRHREVASQAEIIRRAFDGLFVRCRLADASASDGRLLSLYFLIRHGDRERFRGAFRRLQADGPGGLLLTGPWPPYNFVDPEQT